MKINTKSTIDMTSDKNKLTHDNDNKNMSCNQGSEHDGNEGNNRIKLMHGLTTLIKTTSNSPSTDLHFLPPKIY